MAGGCLLPGSEHPPFSLVAGSVGRESSNRRGESPTWFWRGTAVFIAAISVPFAMVGPSRLPNLRLRCELRAESEPRGLASISRPAI